MRRRIALVSGALMALAAISSMALSAGAAGSPQLASTIAVTSTRDNLTLLPAFNRAEIYLMNPDGTNVRRLTSNLDADAFPALSPDGKRIVFDSNRNRAAGEALNTSDVFVMKTDGTEQSLLTRGSSASWSPDGKQIAFHASASGAGTPLRTDPGSATTDSDIFVARVDDTGVENRTNITNSPAKIDDDADWSPDGQSIVYTAHDVGDDPPNPPFLSNSAEIYKINPDGTSVAPKRLTDNTEEERGPSWSPDGTRIVFACRIGGGSADFEICVMNADGTGVVQLTDNTVADLTPTFSPDGQQIVFHRVLATQIQLYVMNADGTDPRQVTFPPGSSLLANWGLLRGAGGTSPVG